MIAEFALATGYTPDQVRAMSAGDYAAIVEVLAERARQ